MTIGRTNKEKVLMDIPEALKDRHETVVPYRHLSQGRGGSPGLSLHGHILNGGRLS
jgi:hypothetical protein